MGLETQGGSRTAAGLQGSGGTPGPAVPAGSAVTERRAAPSTAAAPDERRQGLLPFFSPFSALSPGSPVPPWARVTWSVQWALLTVTALLWALDGLGLPVASAPLIRACSAIVVLLTAVTFADAARRAGRARQRGLFAAWTVLTLSVLAAAIVVAAGAPLGAAVAAVTVAGTQALQAGAIWMVLEVRSPRWTPSSGWDGPVVALGAAAIGTGALELSLTVAESEGGMSTPALVLALAGTALFIVALTATALAPPAPRPQLRWLAWGVTLVAAADLAAAALRGEPAVLAPGDDGLARVLAVLALAGYALLGLAAAPAVPRRTVRRIRPGGRGSSLPALAVVLVTASAAILAAAVIEPRAPRFAAVLALACLLVALIRTRRTLLAVQLRGRDPRPRTDDLTGLANRRALSEALAGDGLRDEGSDDEEWAAWPGGSGWSGWAGWTDEIALLLVDLDRFKDVNEALGHDRGDLLLAEVGARLRTALRPTQLLARLGGDEFAVVLPAAGSEAALRVAAALRASLTEPFEIEGTRLHVQASVGVATCYPGKGEPTDLLRQADVAMYQAKAHGTGVAVYDEAQETPFSAASQRLRRTDELREALERGDLEVHIQPQVDLRSGLICGGEALARWRHPVDGVLLPDSFLPLAEQTGLMRPVAALLLDRALQACATWWAEGFRVPVSVNVGADDLRDPELPERVATLLERYGLPTDALCVEITEQALLTDLPAAAALLTRWRSDGIAVSIDDFGTGYSSLSYLRELPVDEVKLDQAFIGDIGRTTTLTIVRHTIAMAHGLWARTVAEGIEDEATARRLTDLGCDVGQGLYFGAALTPPEFLARLQR